MIALGFIGAVAWTSAAQPVDTLNRWPEPITMGDLAVELIDVIQIRPSSSERPRARINFLFHASDGSGRLFVNDARGTIFVIKNNRPLAEPFLDVAAARGSAFFHEEGDGFHLGLRTFAFHPDAAKPGTDGFGKFYTVNTERVDSTACEVKACLTSGDSGMASHHDVLAEWTVDPTNPDRIDPGSRREFLRIVQPAIHHNTGQLAFNPNARRGSADYGMLYIAVGDGGTRNIGGGQGQNTSTVLGAILRVNPLQGDADPYTVPDDNPFVDDPRFRPEIWAFGLRNPQRFSWDTGGDGKMLIADIGHGRIEEINLGTPGANYGWGFLEGYLINGAGTDASHALPADAAVQQFTYPVAQYDHYEGNAIVGGFVYRGSLLPDLYGKYIFGDIRIGRIFYCDVDDMAPDRKAPIYELTLLRDGVETTLLDILEDDHRADLRFGMDEDGEIYILTKRDGMIRTWYEPFVP